MVTGNYFLNGNDVGSAYGLIIQDTSGFLIMPERKESLSHNWPEQNGIEYDLSAPMFNDAEVTLQCVIAATSDTQYWTRRNALLAQLQLPSWQNFQVVDHGKTYQVFYLKSSNWKKESQTLKGVSVVVVSFELTLKVKGSTL
ncbi:hypothetical protein [Solitalea koreensis]|uniref:Uncharacterized protein n=1 Tax=Solitalea koreensis TaxID=543615 RepID=A0A521BLQ3_9SPHI|nr:hypothetical protein [Solitalea koreensis]SMO48074.1 hypothetical protein SAMN06265350_102319 [Solitalea koreensis]